MYKYESGKITDFECFCNAHYYYKTKNIKYNLLKLIYKIIYNIGEFIEKKIAWKISSFSSAISRALVRQYMKIDKNIEIIENDGLCKRVYRGI